MSEKNIATIQQIYAAFGRGDVPGIMEHVSEELRHFGLLSESTEVPWHLQITRKADVPKFFQALATECDFTRFEPRDFAAAGDVVYSSISFDVTLQRNGRKLSYETLHRFTLKNGRVVDWTGSEDTAKTVKALLG